MKDKIHFRVNFIFTGKERKRNWKMIICYLIFFFLLCIYGNYELNLAHPEVVSLIHGAKM